MQNPLDFLNGEDDREALFLRGPDDVERGPLPVQRLFIEKLDAAERQGDRGPRPLFAVFDVQEILPEFFLGEEMR